MCILCKPNVVVSTRVEARQHIATRRDATRSVLTGLKSSNPRRIAVNPNPNLDL